MEDEAVVSEEPGRLESEELARRSLGPVLNRVLARMEELGELPESDEGERLWKLRLEDSGHIFVIRAPGLPDESLKDEAGEEESVEEKSETALPGRMSEPADEEVRRIRRETVANIYTSFADKKDIMFFSSEYEILVGMVYGDDKDEAIRQLGIAIGGQNEIIKEKKLRPMECVVHLAEIDHLVLSLRGKSVQILIPGEIVEATAALGSFDEILEEQQALKTAELQEESPEKVELQEKQEQSDGTPPLEYPIHYENLAKGISVLASMVEPSAGGRPSVLLCGEKGEVQTPFNRGKEILIRRTDLESEPGDFQINQTFRGDQPFSVGEVKRLLEGENITSLNPGEKRLIKNLSKGVRGKVDFSGSSMLTIEASKKGQLGEMIEETERYMDKLVRMGEILGIRIGQPTSDSFIFWVLPENELALEEGGRGEKLTMEERTLVFGWLTEKLHQKMSVSGNWLAYLSTKVIAQRLDNIPLTLSLGRQGELYTDIGGSNFNFASPLEKAAKRGFPAGSFGRKEIMDEDIILRSETLQREHFVVDRRIAEEANLSGAGKNVSEREVYYSGEKLPVTAVNPGSIEFEQVALNLLGKDENVKERILHILAEKN